MGFTRKIGGKEISSEGKITNRSGYYESLPRPLSPSGSFGGMGINNVNSYAVVYTYGDGRWFARINVQFVGNGASSGSNGGYVYLDGNANATDPNCLCPHLTNPQGLYGGFGPGGNTGYTTTLNTRSSISGQTLFYIVSASGASWTNTDRFNLYGDFLLQFKPAWA